MSNPHDRRTQHVHVFKDDESTNWVVSVGGRRLSRHRTQYVAVAAGHRAAKRHHVELVTHGRNGRIRKRDSYGPDSARQDG